ncbi:MAG: hypothetical protein QOD95_1350, partial [Gammaproteobacteria bacterium]|nr:hypothetical protein [Gammaproteobacteria bacterium]
MRSRTDVGDPFPMATLSLDQLQSTEVTRLL